MIKKYLVLLSAATVLSAGFLTACTPNDQNDPPAVIVESDITDEIPTSSAADTFEPVTDETEFLTQAPSALENVGTFSTIDIYDNPVTESVFADHDLTMVNVFATWCGPCIREIPDLAELAKEYEGSNFQIIGFILDVNQSGVINEETLEAAKELAKLTEAEYPFIMPNSSLRYGVLGNVFSIPETFFVDRDGNVVSERYVGSRSKSQWQQIIKHELSKLK